MSSIYKAIEYLPDELITKEIAQAAIEEGKAELFNTLPKRFLTSDVILSIIQKGNENHSWDSFDLSNIPLELRCDKVCEYAIAKDDDNIIHTPLELLSSTMLSKLLNSTEKNLKYLHLFGEEQWKTEHLIRGVANIYSKTYSSSGYSRGYYGKRTVNDIKPVLIFLSYAPSKVKDKKFYAGLFNTSIAINDINKLTPKRYKGKEYWANVAKHDFDIIPEQYYNYNTLFTAIDNGRLTIEPQFRNSYSLREKELREAEEERYEKLKSQIFSLMDDKMADAVIRVNPKSFRKLPTQFKTSKRLILAIQKDKHSTIIDFAENESLFTEEVCKAYIYRNGYLPILPSTIWTDDFIYCCMMYGTNYYWFKRIPKELQVADMVNRAIEVDLRNADHAREDLITIDIAYKLFKGGDYYRKYIPKYFLQDFCNETGLSEDFFGGEVSYSELREDREKNTYCRVGHSFIGYIDNTNYNTKDYRVVLTRRTPASFRPIELFEQNVVTFHTTWLEKLISDNDPAFVKPSPCSKNEKAYQVNGYFKLDKIEEYNGSIIYSNTILGEKVYYTALIGKYIVQHSTLSEIKASIDKHKAQDIA